MLITRWNEASRALPVLTLKSNYLDRWPNDCIRLWYTLGHRWDVPGFKGHVCGKENGAGDGGDPPGTVL